MTQRLSCHHGHRFDVPPDAERKVVCPLCGAVTKYQGTVETKRPSAFDQTLDLPTSDHAETVPGTNGDKTLDSNGSVPTPHEVLPTVSFDNATEEDAATAEVDRDASSAKTVALDKTLNLDRPDLTADDKSYQDPAQTISLGKMPTLDGATIEPDDAHESRNVAKTVMLGKTVSLDRPPAGTDSRDESNLVSGTIDTRSASTIGGAKLAPTVLLRTLEATARPVIDDEEAVPDPPVSPATTSDSEAKPPNLPGYTVINELGRGGMGVVYRARHEKRNREVALKTLLHISPVELQRFKQEFRSLADIAHPNLAGLYDLLSDGETWCFSMEILEAVDFTEYVWSGFEALRRKKGQTLLGAVPTGEPRLSPAIKERLFEGLKQLVLGLNTLHQAGMLHRDIKPSNVLVTTEGRVVLVDFGLASQFEEGSEDRPIGIQGTPEYMAPEQAACNPLSPASDWYAVGVMIYEVLTGRFPIAGKPLRVILRKQTDTPTPPRELEPNVPDDLNELCVALLDLDQRNRPTATDVLRCIGADELIESLHVSARVGSGQTLELVGREGHLRGLQSSFRQVVGGMTKTIFVHGKSGMGKSVLIQKFLERIRAEDKAVVLSGRCYEQESVPFKALDNLIDSLADHLTSLTEAEVRATTPADFLPLIRLFPVLGQIRGATDAWRPSIENADQQELRQRAMNALRELLKRLGERKPVVLHIDDLQWGDEDSAELLADLVRPPEAPRVLILGSYRTENRDASDCLRAIDKAYSTGQYRPHREEIAVDSLQEADAKRLALMLLGRDDKKSHELADKIARESRGWPFFVWELAQHVQDTPEIADQSLELDEVIWTRVNRLPVEARRLLELVAVTGRPIPANEAYQAINGLEKGQSYLAQLRTRNFVRTTEAEDEDTLVETYHDRIRESVVQHLDEPTVQKHSFNLAVTIEQVSGIHVSDLRTHIARTPEFDEPAAPFELPKQQWQRVFDLAYFFDAAGEHERAFPFALCAAEQARSQNALEVSVQQFRIALRGSTQADLRTRFRVAEGLGDAQMLRGHYDEAAQHFQEARALVANDVARARIEGKLGDLAFRKGEMGNAAVYLEKALTELGSPPPSHLLVQIGALLKEGTIQLLHTCFPHTFIGRQRGDTPQCQMDLFRVRLYDRITIVYWFSRGMVPTLWAHMRQMNLAERYPPSQELSKTYAFHSITMSAIPNTKRGIAYAEKAYQISSDLGDLWGRGKARSFHTFSLFVEARFGEAVEKSHEAVRLLEQAGDVWEANMARMMYTWSLYFLGDLRSALREAKHAYRTASEVGDFSAMAIAMFAWMQIHPASAPEDAAQTEVDRPREDTLSRSLAIVARGLELLRREDKPREAAQVLQEALDLAKRNSIRNVCVFTAEAWKVTALRVVAERETDRAARRSALKKAEQAAREALKITESYLACRSHALRECALLAVLEGKEEHARKFFATSLSVAQDQGARYHYEQTLLAQGEAGLKFGWADAAQQVEKARAAVKEMENFTEVE